MKLKRIISALLLLAMLLSCLPLTALAVETGTPDVGDVPTSEITGIMDVDSPAEPVTLALDADTAGEHYFYLSAQTTSTSQQLLIRPTKVYYDADDTIAQALLNSGYNFTGLDEQYSKFISKIQNVDGNFTYCGDFPEAVTLLEQASSIHYLYFSESTNAQMTSALQSLMQVAADYLDKPTDVQAAAKAVYDEVLAQYPGQTEEETAVREVYEETHIQIDLCPGFREVVSYSPKRDVLKDVIYFLGRARNYDFIPQESEIAQIKWVEMSLAHSFLSYDNDKQLVNRARPLIREMP